MRTTQPPQPPGIPKLSSRELSSRYRNQTALSRQYLWNIVTTTQTSAMISWSVQKKEDSVWKNQRQDRVKDANVCVHKHKCHKYKGFIYSKYQKDIYFKIICTILPQLKKAKAVNVWPKQAQELYLFSPKLLENYYFSKIILWLLTFLNKGKTLQEEKAVLTKQHIPPPPPQYAYTLY